MQHQHKLYYTQFLNQQLQQFIPNEPLPYDHPLGARVFKRTINELLSTTDDDSLYYCLIKLIYRH
ncbi:hypothetical protein [Escherichia phage vB_EcoM_JNE01]|nr:hypothetical protein [Escherichia phage vB_EcoM_JNE01]